MIYRCKTLKMQRRIQVELLQIWFNSNRFELDTNLINVDDLWVKWIQHGKLLNSKTINESNRQTWHLVDWPSVFLHYYFSFFFLVFFFFFFFLLSTFSFMKKINWIGKLKGKPIASLEHLFEFKVRFLLELPEVVNIWHLPPRVNWTPHPLPTATPLTKAIIILWKKRRKKRGEEQQKNTS